MTLRPQFLDLRLQRRFDAEPTYDASRVPRQEDATRPIRSAFLSDFRSVRVLLMSFPRINVVSAADFAGEMGAIENYANPKAITGRAGLFPSRYQSDRVDRAQGPLVRRANRSLRAAIMGIAENLIVCNIHFRGLAARWKMLGKSAGHSRVSVACRFCRIAFHMVAGRHVFHHPSIRERPYILDKLIAFHLEHKTPLDEALRDLYQAAEQIPKKDHADEGAKLDETFRATRKRGQSGPQPLGELIALILLGLGVGQFESKPSGEEEPA